MTPRRVAVLISGRGSNLRHLVERAENYSVGLVASDRPEAPGLSWARDHAIPTFTRDVRAIGKAGWENMLDAALIDAGVEAIALAGYMRLLSAAFVARWQGRIVNIHPSLLPAYKGLDTHARALAAGEAEAGCSVHLVTEDLDDGEVLGRARVPIRPDETAESLAARVLAEEHRLYPRILSQWCAR